jgi:hypothetical protein
VAQLFPLSGGRCVNGLLIEAQEIVVFFLKGHSMILNPLYLYDNQGRNITLGIFRRRCNGGSLGQWPGETSRGPPSGRSDLLTPAGLSHVCLSGDLPPSGPAGSYLEMPQASREAMPKVIRPAPLALTFMSRARRARSSRILSILSILCSGQKAGRAIVDNGRRSRAPRREGAYLE